LQGSSSRDFLIVFLPFNTYWGFGGRWGVEWILGCDCYLPLALVWIQEIAILVGIIIVLGQAGVLGTFLPMWLPRTGTWVMAVAFAGVGLQNVLGDNTPQQSFLFAPLALIMSALSVVVALRRKG
jgi:hypothetical protein